MDGWMDAMDVVDGCFVGWLVSLVVRVGGWSGWLVGWAVGWVDGWMELVGWLDSQGGWMDGWMQWMYWMGAWLAGRLVWLVRLIGLVG